MLTYHRESRATALGAVRGAHFALNRSFCASFVRTRGVVVDRLLFTGEMRKPPRSTPRQTIQVLLSGRMRLRAGGEERWLEAGDVSIEPAETWSHFVERWEGEPFEIVCFEWEPDYGGSTRIRDSCVGKLASHDLEAVRALSATLPRAEGAETIASEVSLALAQLRSAGLPVPLLPAHALMETLSPQTRELARTFGRVLSNLAERPMMIDIESAMGRSARQMQRLVSDFFDGYNFTPGGWRERRDRWRIEMGATLMTAPNATTEAVASALGYTGPQAFCLAVARAGLPSPGEIGRAIRRLR